jgi:penicillin-binding protein 2D
MIRSNSPHRRAASPHRWRALHVGALAALVIAPVAGAQQEEAWQLVQPPQASLVFARDGSLIGELGRELRSSVSIATLPKYLPQAFVAVEDHRFYQHDGVDLIGVAGALKDHLTGDGRGASTITQQLVGNMHPGIIDRTDKSVNRKLREQAAAREMERHYNKAQILEAYLNQIPFGHGWHGVEMAARHYFGKGAAQVSLAEAATLAAMPKGPALYDPVKYPDRTRDRRNLVLDRMAAEKYITPAQAAAAKREPIITAGSSGMSAPSPYFVDAVRIQAERAGVPVMNGGYRIHTTLDPVLQRAAVTALSEGLTRVEESGGYRHMTYAKRIKGRTDYLQGAVVAMDPTTGAVRAMVGGRNHAEAPFNRAVDALRQPGSAFKPIVYAAAIKDSIPANAIMGDTALSIVLEDSTIYSPSNYEGTFLGPITMRDALAKSRNVVAVELGLRVGLDSVIALAQRLGIDTPIQPFPSTAIGASAVRPLDLVAAYTGFANLGVAVSPRLVVRVEDRQGRTVWQPEPEASALALDPEVAFIVRDMMRDVVERGTGGGARRAVPPEIPVAGKTGTTNDNTDVWFIGMTPDIVAGVWLGFDRPTTITSGVTGGGFAAPIWGEMIGQYYQGRQTTPWTTPGGVIAAELDRATGALADSLTPPERRYTEYFLDGTEPLELRPSPWKLFKAGAIIFQEDRE